MNSETQSDCELLGDEGIILQTALALLSFGTLLVKRQKERPKRSWKIWLLDTSKQICSAGVAHTLNLILAIWLAKKEEEASGDSCAWYFVTIIFDTTIGVLLSCMMLVGIERNFDRFQLNKLKSGNYFKMVPNLDPATCDEKPRLIFIDIGAWIIQLLIWLVIELIAKMVLAGMQSILETPLTSLTGQLFSGLKSAPYLKLMIVTVITPIIGNSFQFWISDNFLKKNEFTDDEEYVLRGTFFDEDLIDEPTGKYSTHNSLNTSATMTVELGRTNALQTSLKD